MKLRLPSKVHPKIGCKVIFDNRLDLRALLRYSVPQDWEDGERDYCVYSYDLYGEAHYYGHGIYYDIEKYGFKKWWKDSRAFETKKKHLAHNTVNKNWVIRIIASGLTKNQARALEAYFIREASKRRALSKKGQFVWDGVSLMNKHREWKAEKMIDKYLNLDGNNYWEVISRTPDYY